MKYGQKQDVSIGIWLKCYCYRKVVSPLVKCTEGVLIEEGHTLNKEERRLLIELICDKQTKMIVKDYHLYNSDKYKRLEVLKIKIKDM